MRKNVFLIQIFLIMQLFVFCNNVYAEEKTVFSMNTVTSSSGEDVTLKLRMDNNPKFGLLFVKILYDTNKLEYVDSEVVGLKKALIKGVDQNKQKNVVLYALTIDSNKLLDDTGDILKLKLKIKNDCKEDAEVKIDVTDYGVDENTSLDYEVKNGMVKVKKNIKSIDISKNNDFSLAEEVKEKNLKNITWTSSDEKIATVDKNGNVHFKKDGNVTITARDGNKVVLSKEYYGNEKIKKQLSISKKVLFVAAGILLVFVILLISLFIRKKRKNIK